MTSLPHLHDRRALEEIAAALPTEELSASLEQGGLSQLATSVVADELARRVLSDSTDFRAPATRAYRVLDVAIEGVLALWFGWWTAALVLVLVGVEPPLPW